MTLDLMFVARNRREFTEQSLAALLRNTNWDAVSHARAFDDGSEDGTLELLRSSPLDVTETCLRNPTRIFNDFVFGSNADLVAKIDNDVVLPPGWLDEALATFRQHPTLELLGLEAKASSAAPPHSYEPADHVGGVFVARRETFYDRNFPCPHGTYSGFTDWQRITSPIRGWIVPPIRMFLLDRLPFEPWKGLSARYERAGWQRPWRRYTQADRRLWRWWQPAPMNGGPKHAH